MDLLHQWRYKITANRQQIESLLGKLHHVGKCVKPARLFVARMLQTLRASPKHGYISLCEGFSRDVNWFINFMPQWNRRAMMIHLPLDRFGLNVELDSCLSGAEALFGQEMYTVQFPDFIMSENHHITHLEMLNIVVVTKT